MNSRVMIFAIILAVLVLGWTLPAQAALHTEKIVYRHGNTALVGYLAYDDSIRGKRPGVLVVHEWWGLNDFARTRAEHLAEEGYVAFALDMYGDGKTTDHPKEAAEWSSHIRKNKQIGTERFMAAYEWLRNHTMVDNNKIAAIGYCFGGFVVLAMAQEGLDLRGVVSFHGGFPAERAEPNKIKAKILVCHGADDGFTTQDQIHQFQENLEYANADWQFIIYGGAKHSFTNPDSDKRGMPGLGYNQNADRRSWKAMLDFFQEIFGL